MLIGRIFREVPIAWRLRNVLLGPLSLYWAVKGNVLV